MHYNLTDQYLQGFFDFIDWADGFLFLALILIITDLFFGVKAAQKRNETVRRSRALRRSIDKICAYVLWVIVAYSFGEVFGELFGVIPVPFIALGFIYFVEIESIAKNYFEWRGIKVKINLLKFFTQKTNLIEIEKDNSEKPDTDTKTKTNKD